MVTPSHAELGIEIGKAQAMAKASQESIKRVEDTLNDRMDRFEIKVDEGFKEIKMLFNNLHQDIVAMKIQDSHEVGAEKQKKINRSSLASGIALVFSAIAAISSFVGYFFHGFTFTIGH